MGSTHLSSSLLVFEYLFDFPMIVLVNDEISDSTSGTPHKATNDYFEHELHGLSPFIKVLFNLVHTSNIFLLINELHDHFFLRINADVMKAF